MAGEFLCYIFDKNRRDMLPVCKADDSMYHAGSIYIGKRKIISKIEHRMDEVLFSFLPLSNLCFFLTDCLGCEAVGF